KLMKEMNRNRQMKSVWEIAAPDRREKRFGKHPTQKPLALLERILLASSNEGDLVLDPVLGSGTTAVAALRLQRRAWGFELDTSYLMLSLARAVGELCFVQVFVCSFPLDLGGLFVDRSKPGARNRPMPPRAKVVHREQKYFFVGADPREIIFTVEARSLEEAWRHFLSSKNSAERVLSVVKTETEIYLAQ
ncbi:MAG: DNA-methyltransferase, partial [Terriglobia bacterium]